jgi:methionyl-tRNA formyltransferase
MKPTFAFFGTDSFSVAVLDCLQQSGLVPAVIVTAPDRPAGRGQTMQSPAAKLWADKNNVPVMQPEKLDTDFIATLSAKSFDVFALASYGKIVPQAVLDIPKKGVLNVHPSLLPKYRGASPIESAMLADDRETGVTIMLMDSKMDHGPIVAQEKVFFAEWPSKAKVEEELANLGGQMLARALPQWVLGAVEAAEQNHDVATFTKKISKEDGAVEFTTLFEAANARKNFLKIKALNPWPGAFFFYPHGGRDIRVKIIDADFVEGTLSIKRVIPEGRKEMSWDDFQKGFIQSA